MILEVKKEFDEATGERTYPVIPAGVYDAQIMEVVECKSGEQSAHPNTPMTKLKFVISDPDDEVNGFSLYSWFRHPVGEGTEWMDDKTRKELTNAFKRLWIATAAPVGESGPDTDDLLYTSCRIDVSLDNKDPNQPRNNIKDVLPLA